VHPGCAGVPARMGWLFGSRRLKRINAGRPRPHGVTAGWWRLSMIAVLTKVEPNGQGWTFPESRSPRGDRNEFRSTLCPRQASRATRQTRTRVNVSENCYNPLYARAVELMAIEHYSGSHKGWTCWTRLNTPVNCAPHAVTEINFGLHSAGRRRLARHDG